MVLPSFTFVLFGATGDLAGKKILPALYQLYASQRIPADCLLIGNSRTPHTDTEFREVVYRHLKKQYPKLDEAIWEHFANRIFFVPGSAADSETVDRLCNRLEQLRTQGFPCKNIMYHIATLPELYPDIIEHLGKKLKKSNQTGWQRILIEKPFGTDLASSKRLNALTKRYFQDDRIFRIDHFLGKETVQNILAFRFANGLFEPIWNHNYIDNIQISALETDGLEGREIFYDTTGVLRDYVQNHIVQLLALVTMDAPQSLESDAVRHQRLKILRRLRVKTSSTVTPLVYGQYGVGEIQGEKVRAYIQEKHIPEQSTTETFVALKASIDHDLWQNTPVYIRMGKRMAERVTEISIQFKDPERPLPEFAKQMTPNILTIRIQPNEGIVLHLDVKKPGHGYQLERTVMPFCYATAFSKEPMVDAYERLIAEAMIGNHSLFPTAQEVEAAWAFIDPMLISNTQAKPVVYAAGSYGPLQADALLKQDGRFWIEPSPLVCNLPLTSGI